MDTDFLAWALADFSGDVAADARSDGPCCLLSAVEHRRDQRLLAAVLDHEPPHDDIRAFLRRVHTALAVRALTLFGVTIDGAARAPTPLVEGCGDVPQHICMLHLVAEVNKAVCGAGASARKNLAAQQPPRRTGPPSPPAAKPAARTQPRLAAHRAALCTQRSLFVQRPLHTTERKTLG